MVCLIALLPFETILYYFFISLKKCDKKHSVGLQSHCKMEKTSSWPSSSRRDRRGAVARAAGGRSASWAVDQQPSACSKPVNSYLQSTHKSIIRPSEDCQTRADNHKKIVRQDRNLNIQFNYMLLLFSPFSFIPVNNCMNYKKKFMLSWEIYFVHQIQWQIGNGI